MKNRLILFIIFILLLPKVYGQSSSTTIDSLVKYHVINKNDRPLLEKNLKYYRANGGVSENRGILGALYSLMLKKRFKIDPHKTGFYYAFSDGALAKSNRDSINTSLHTLLNNINKAGLLTNRVYKYGFNNIDSNKYVIDLQLVGSVMDLISRLEWLAPEKLMPVADELHTNGIVSDQSFLRLKNDIENRGIEQGLQLAEYLNNVRIIDMAAYRDSSSNWLEMLHRDIAAILPGLEFADFKYTEIPDTSFSLPGVRLRTSFTSNGIHYAYTSLPFSTFRRRAGRVSPKDISLLDLYRVFNKVLIDQHSPYQIHSLMSPHPDREDRDEKFALIALKDGEVQTFMKKPCMQYMLVSMDNYYSGFTSAKIDSLITGWQKIGLFDHLSKIDLDKAMEAAKASDLYSEGGILSNFPGVTYSLREIMTATDLSYTSFLKKLAGLTHGEFKPTKVTQAKTKQGVKLQYQWKGKSHSFILPKLNYWLDPKLTRFINELGRENKLSGAFYQTEFDNSIVYLTAQQHKYVISHKLLDVVAFSKK